MYEISVLKINYDIKKKPIKWKYKLIRERHEHWFTDKSDTCLTQTVNSKGAGYIPVYASHNNTATQESTNTWVSSKTSYNNT